MRKQAIWIGLMTAGLWLGVPAHVPAAPTTQPTEAVVTPVSSEALMRGLGGYLMQGSGISAEVRVRAQAMLTAAGSDVLAQADAALGVLALMHPEYAGALRDLAEDRGDIGAARLRKLTEAKDSYLAAGARLSLARWLSMAEQYDAALPVLRKLTEAQSPVLWDAGEAVFLQGVAQANLLDRAGAVQTLIRFLQMYPEAPERMRVGAAQLAARLALIQDGTLPDVEDRMGFSRRKLEQTQTGKPTQEEQARIVSILDKLIKEAEDKENNGGGGGGGGGQSGGPGSGAPGGVKPSGSPAQQSTAPPGAAQVGDLHGVKRNPSEGWGGLSARERQEVLDSLKASLPERDRALIEQYFQSLQEKPKP